MNEKTNKHEKLSSYAMSEGLQTTRFYYFFGAFRDTRNDCQTKYDMPKPTKWWYSSRHACRTFFSTKKMQKMSRPLILKVRGSFT